jgi:hypothetical protein
MQFVNIKETAPEVFYIFVSQTNLLAQHNLKFTKQFSSGTVFDWGTPEFVERYNNGTVDYLPFIINGNKTCHTLSAFENSITAEYRVEYNAEMQRHLHFNLCPSRLSAIYAFGSYAECEKVSKKYGWDLSSVKRFKVLDYPLTRIAKVNMEIVSLDRYAQIVAMCDGHMIEATWAAYGNGIGEIEMELPTVNGRQVFKSGLIWEYLIEGVVQLFEV